MKRLANPGGSETAGKIHIDNLHFKICTINYISLSALLVAVLQVCSTLHSGVTPYKNFIRTTSSLHVIVWYLSLF